MKLSNILLSLFVMLGIGHAAQGQQVCQPRRVQQGVTYQQTYVQQPVQAQAQVYQQVYQQQVQLQQQTINYPVVVGVPLSDLGINYYFSVSAEKRESRIVEQVTKELLKNMNQNGYGILVPLQPQQIQQQQQQQQIQQQQQQQQIQQQQQQQQIQQQQQQQTDQSGVVTQPESQTPPPPQPAPVTQPTPAPPQPQTGPATPAQPQTQPQGRIIPGSQGLPQSVKSQLQVVSLFQNKCMSCHKPGEIKKDVKLFNSDGGLFDNDLETRLSIMNAVLGKDGVSAMPPKNPLTSDEKKVIMNWVQEKL